jgi:ribosome-associated protein
LETLEILKIAANALNDKKAINIKAIKIGDLTVLTDYFLLATATSSTHVRSLSEEVEFKLEENGIRPLRVEGKSTGWILLDFGTVIVHVFTRDSREFYGLDQMWADGEEVELSNMLNLGVEEE